MLDQEKTIGVFEIRRRFGKLLQDVTAGREKLIVERNGEPIAALVPIETYNQWKRRGTLFFDKLRSTAQRANLTMRRRYN